MALVLQPTEDNLTFGKRYAILNLDWMALLIDGIKNTSIGQEFITNCSRWNEAVHQKHPQPLTIFISLYFLNTSQPELAKDSPFAKIIDG